MQVTDDGIECSYKFSTSMNLLHGRVEQIGFFGNRDFYETSATQSKVFIELPNQDAVYRVKCFMRSHFAIREEIECTIRIGELVL